jgi:hypothetical protein
MLSDAQFAKLILLSYVVSLKPSIKQCALLKLVKYSQINRLNDQLILTINTIDRQLNQSMEKQVVYGEEKKQNRSLS